MVRLLVRLRLKLIKPTWLDRPRINVTLIQKFSQCQLRFTFDGQTTAAWTVNRHKIMF